MRMMNKYCSNFRPEMPDSGLSVACGSMEGIIERDKT